MDHMAHRKALAAEVRAAIARDGRKQVELARAAGLSPAALSRKLNCEVKFYAEELVALADVLSIDAGDLLTLSLPKPKSAAGAA